MVNGKKNRLTQKDILQWQGLPRLQQKNAIRLLLFRGRKGQLWTSLAYGFSIIVVSAMLFTITYQVYVSGLQGRMLDFGVDAENASLIEQSWRWVMVPVVLAVAYGILERSKKRELPYGFG